MEDKLKEVLEKLEAAEKEYMENYEALDLIQELTGDSEKAGK